MYYNVLSIFRVMIGAVSTKQNPPLLHFFNNCFNDEFSGRESMYAVPTTMVIIMYLITYRFSMESCSVHFSWSRLLH